MSEPGLHRRTEAPSVQSSQADVWYLKHIVFGSGSSRRPVKIITQNFNGPCSFIAICNILILRGHIEILPPDRMTVSYEFLSQLVGEYLLINCPDIDISAALSIMPSTTKGLDLNPRFTSITAFSPSSSSGPIPTSSSSPGSSPGSDIGAGELDLFAQAGISLVHGWVVDPECPGAEVIVQIGDYDSAATLIADADYLTRGKLLGAGESDDPGSRYEPGGGQAGPSRVDGSRGSVGGGSSGGGGGGGSAGAAGPSSLARRHDSTYYSDEDRRKIEQAIILQQFLESTRSQLTYHGLFQLASTIQPGSLVALFRNAHLSVVYKSPGRPVISRAPTDIGASAGGAGVVDANSDSNADTDDANASADADADDSAGLYALVTDDVFLNEPSIVWERLEDVDGGSSMFVDSDFHRSVPIGGDVAGQTAEDALLGRLEYYERARVGDGDSADRALARQLQAEEDERAREVYRRRREALERRRAEGGGGGSLSLSSSSAAAAAVGGERRNREGARSSSGRGKKVKNCIVM